MCTAFANEIRDRQVSSLHTCCQEKKTWLKDKVPPEGGQQQYNQQALVIPTEQGISFVLELGELEGNITTLVPGIAEAG